MSTLRNASPSAPAVGAAFEKETYSKVVWRIMPLLFLCYLTSYLDRNNVGFAKLQMLDDLNFSETVYGLGAGILFVGYALCEVPSNLILRRVGARVWIFRIMLTWGIVSAAQAFVRTPSMYYTMRLLLGVAEAGFFPGVIFYLTFWFPAAWRGKITAMFMTGIAVSGVLGGPFSGWVMQSMSGTYGLAAWQWMFIIEGIPAVLLGFAILLFLPDRVSDARWLSADETALIGAQVGAEEGRKTDLHIGQAFANPRVWLCAFIYFSFIMGLAGVGFWMPTIIRATGVKSVLDIGLLSAIPYATATVVMLLVGRSADRLGERRWHVAIPGVLGAIGLALSTLCGNETALAMAALTLATSGILTTLPLFWSLPTALLGGAAAAAGIALISSVGNLAAFVSPFMIGWLKDLTHTTNSGMYLLSAVLLVGSLLTLKMPARLVNG